MKKVLSICALLLLVVSGVSAKNVHDIELPDSLTVGNEQLQLNGYGLRKKWFLKVYLGSLYTNSKASSTEQVLTQPGAKLIRMNFIYHKVERKKIVDAFDEGFEKNSPQLLNNPARQQFLDLFDADFVAGDQVNLELAADGTVAVRHNSKALGSVKSKQLVEGILLIYLGDDPADEEMKEGMLGQD